jgi:predicted nucleotidyltransferase
VTPLRDALASIAPALRKLDAKFALVGGLAVSARTEPRFTRDIDLAVAVPADKEAEALVHNLRTHGYHPVAHLEQEATGRLATVRLQAGGATGTVIDLLFASSGIEPEVVAAAEPLEVLPGVRVPVARLSHLLALKVLSREDRSRPQDRADALTLLAAAQPADLDETRQALALIGRRGYARGRDLAHELSRLIADARG